MFIAMNRFQVVKGREDEFEEVWRNRDTRLTEVAGFVSFHLLRGPEGDGHILYTSHTVWDTRAAFEGWTKSDAFRQAHKDAGSLRDLYAGPPDFEGFEAVV